MAHPSVSGTILGDLVPAENLDHELLDQPLLFIDTAGALMYEAVDADAGQHESKYNYGEVDLVV